MKRFMVVVSGDCDRLQGELCHADEPLFSGRNGVLSHSPRKSQIVGRR